MREDYEGVIIRKEKRFFEPDAPLVQIFRPLILKSRSGRDLFWRGKNTFINTKVCNRERSIIPKSSIILKSSGIDAFENNTYSLSFSNIFSREKA